MLYPEHGFLDRFDAAAADGFRGVEYIAPYDYPAEAIAERLRRLGLEQVLFNSPADDWAAGDRGLACLPGRQDEFADGIERAIGYARALDCRRVHVMAGVVPVGVAPEDAAVVLAGNLRRAAERLGQHGIMALIEPINAVDMPGYALGTLDAAETMLAAVAHDNLYLQYDFYHMAMTGVALAENFARLLPRIRHVQVADAPGRHEPGTGQVDYAAVFAAVAASGYDGWIGAEYRPAAGTSEGLGWMPR